MQIQITLDSSTTPEQAQKAVDLISDFYGLTSLIDVRVPKPTTAQFEQIARELATSSAPFVPPQAIDDRGAREQVVERLETYGAIDLADPVAVFGNVGAETIFAGGTSLLADVPPVRMAVSTFPEGYLDSEGLPHDARIHAGSKAKVKAGSWRIKPGADPAFVEQVKAEIRAIMTTGAAPAPVAVVPAPVAVTYEAAACFHDVAVVVPPPPPAAAEPALPVPATFNELLDYIGAELGLLRLQMADVKSVAKACGFVDVAGEGQMQYVAMHPQRIPEVYHALRVKQGLE